MRERYLENKLEPPRENWSVPIALQRPIGGDVNFAESGEVKVEEGGLSLEFTYSSLSDERRETLRNLSRDFELATRLLGNKDREWRRLLSLEVRTDGGEKLMLTPYLERYEVCFNPIDFIDDSQAAHWAWANHFSRSVFILGASPTVPRALIVLLHELGHLETGKRADADVYNWLKDYQQEKGPRKFLITRKTLENKAELLLKSERRAWAFALKELRPLIGRGPFSVENVRKYIHGAPLGSYSNFIREVLGPRKFSEFVESLIHASRLG